MYTFYLQEAILQKFSHMCPEVYVLRIPKIIYNRKE